MCANQFFKSSDACLQNGKRLCEDAQWMFDIEHLPSAYALSILAQEEFAKAFLLHLIGEHVIPWNTEVQRSLRDHSCKHLLVLIMDWLQPPIEEFLAKLKEPFNKQEEPSFPSHVASALNIYRHEKIRRWKSQNWCWLEDPDYDSGAQKVGDGHVDRLKQDALYVRISKTGEIASLPSTVPNDEVEKEFEKAKRLGDLVGRLNEGEITMSGEYETLKATIKILFAEEEISRNNEK